MVAENMVCRRIELVENFLVVWKPEDGTKLYKMGFYGKPVGILKPKNPEFEVPLILDLMEGLYLTEKKIITVYKKSKKVTRTTLSRKAKQLYVEFDEKYSVYKDLRDKGLIVTPGIKFGCDFAGYNIGPGLEHAPYMISVKKSKADITATEIVKAGRLATTVRKRFIIAVPKDKKNEVNYVIFKWFKA